MVKLSLILTLSVFFNLITEVTVYAETDKEQARSFFQQGAELYNAGDYTKALKMFKNANKLAPSWKIYYNIGQCESVLKNYGKALESFENYLSEGGDDVSSERADSVVKDINRLRTLSGDVNIKGPDGAAVFIDNRQRGNLPIIGGLSVAVGMHNVKVVYKGSTVYKQDVRIKGQHSLQIEIENDAETENDVKTENKDAAQKQPVADNKTAPQPNIESDNSAVSKNIAQKRNKKVVAGGVITGIGGALLLSGVVTGIVSRSKTSELEKNCPDKTCENESDKDIHDSALTLSHAANVLIPVGSAVIITGIVLIIMGKKKEQIKSAAIKVVPEFGPHHGGLMFIKRF